MASKPKILVQALVENGAYCSFYVRADLVQHFGIDPKLSGTNLVAFRPKVVPVAGATPVNDSKITSVAEAGAGSVSVDIKRIIGKGIIIPAGTGLIRKRKGVDITVKNVLIRVPSVMTLPAIILWINTQFKTASKKPTIFRTAAGAKVSINITFTDPARLPNKKDDNTTTP